MMARLCIRTGSGCSVSWRARGQEAGTTTARWQDKRAHLVRRSGGCFCRFFRVCAHVAAVLRNVRSCLNPLGRLALSHIAGPHYGR